MSLADAIALSIAILALLGVLGGIATVIFQIGGFRTMVTERFRALEARFTSSEDQHLREVSDLKHTVSRIDATVSCLREDRVRLDGIEERVHELSQRMDSFSGMRTV